MVAWSPATVLALGAHPDDVEFGAGASLSRFAQEGSRVVCVAFSACEESNPGFDLREEARSSGEALGAEYRVGFLPVREFPRQKVLDSMIALREELKPELVLTHSVSDFHQDHVVVQQETLRAFRTCTVLGYEVPWSCQGFNPTLFMAVNPDHAEARIRALETYKSQSHRGYMNKQTLQGTLSVAGSRINVPLAEAFEINRLVVR